MAMIAVDDRAAAFARLFDAVHEGVYSGTLSASGTSTLVANPFLKRLLGYPLESADALVLPFAPERFLDPQARSTLLERLHGTGRVQNYLLRLRRLDGTPFWIELTAHADPVLGDRATLRVDALVRDVSDRKQLDDQSRDLYQQLLQAEKMAALGQTISGVAHELNNPLATILACAERLADRSADESARRSVEIILRESERAARIVRNLLTFARKRQTTRMQVDVNQIVRETLALRAYEQRATNVRVIQALAAGLPQVFADGHQVQQVLLNLIINAEQAIALPHSGTIVIRTWHDGARNTVVVEVNDDGPGIAEEMQGRIFDPFFTTKGAGKGTGLGLTVAYAIVQEHGGRIWLKSRLGEGASFFVEVPVGLPQLQALPGTSPALSFELFKGRRLLVVEDEPALSVAVSEALSDAGFIVDTAADGDEALQRVERSTYDLIVCDLKMPRRDGEGFYRAIAAGRPALARRVIFVTGESTGPAAERFLASTGCAWLAKPFRLGDLLRAARDTLSSATTTPGV